MSKLVAGTLVLALLGITTLAFACDLQCQLEASAAATTGDECPAHESNPAAPKHSSHTQATPKTLGTLAAPYAVMLVAGDTITLSEVSVGTAFEPRTSVPVPLALRI